MEFIDNFNQSSVYIFAFVIAFIVSLCATPLSRKFAYFVGAVDHPKERGMHTKTMPLAGGTAIVAGFFITLLLFEPFIGHYSIYDYVGLIGGGLIITVVGLLDDIYDVKASIRMFFQILSALIVVYSGTEITVFSWPFAPEGVIHLGALSGIVTVLWIVGITNAVNFLDGLDGLAAGVSSIASLSLMFIAILNIGEVGPVPVLLSAALAGSCLGFLPHNFNPATIFMGDTGSTFLGFTLSVISIQGMMKSYTAVTFIIPVCILGLPIFDTFVAISRRLLAGQPIYKADRGHLHHKLVDKGISHKKAVLVLYTISGSLGIAGILVALNDIFMAIGIIVLLLMIWVVDILLTIRKRKNKEEKVHSKI